LQVERTPSLVLLLKRLQATRLPQNIPIHTYNHREVDGALGGQFIKNVAERLEKFGPATTGESYWTE
jgi:hypothetical protein